MASALLPLSHGLWVNPPSPFSEWVRGSRIPFRSLCLRNWSTKVGKRGRTTVPICGATPVVFQNLEADDFRHPLDKQNTLLLRMIPGLNELGKALLGSVEILVAAICLIYDYYNCPPKILTELRRKV